MNRNGTTQTPDTPGAAGLATGSRDQFVAFLREFQDDLVKNSEAWENRDLSSFLNAFASWVEDMDGYYRNRGEAAPDQPTWATLIDMFRAAKLYE